MQHLKKLAVTSITMTVLALGFGRTPFTSMRARFYDLTLTLAFPVELGFKSETLHLIAGMSGATTANTPNSTIARTLTLVADPCGCISLHSPSSCSRIPPLLSPPSPVLTRVISIYLHSSTSRSPNPKPQPQPIGMIIPETMTAIAPEDGCLSAQR
jgi:hypothetical protein